MVSRLSRSCWAVMVGMLLVHTTHAGVRVRRQLDATGPGLEEEVDPVEAVTRFLDTLEAEALLHLDTLITDQEAQDRVLLEDVQNLIFAVQSISEDPTLTPVALAAIATNPTSVFLIGSLVASTVLASQVSSMALVGQTLTFNTNQGGLIRLLLDVVTSVMRGFDSIASDRTDGSGDVDGDDGSGSGSGDYDDDMEGSGAAAAEDQDLLSSVAQVIRQVLGGQQDEDAGLEEDGSGSGDEMEAAPSFSVDIQEDSFLDLVFNIIPDTIDSITGGNTEDYEYVYDEDNRVGMNMSTSDPSDGGSSVGGMTVSLHTVDVAKLFVDVQKTLLENTSGLNCTCGAEMLSEENITTATIKLIQEEKERIEKRRRQLDKKKRYLRNRRPKLLEI